MNKKVLWIVIVVVIVIAIIAAVSKQGGEPTSTEPIKIGGAYILSGPVAQSGELQKNGSYIAIDEINAAGGINGRPLELVLEDSTFDSKTAVNAYNALKLKGIKFYIADGSPVVSSIRPLAVADKNLIFTAAATTPVYFDDNNLSCRIALTARSFGPGFANLLLTTGYMKVATLLPDNEYGRGLFSEFEKVFSQNGGKVIIAEFYNATAGTADYRTNITKIKSVSSDIDAVVVTNVANTVEPMLQQIQELKVAKPIVTDHYTINNPALKNITLAEGALYVDYEYSRAENPKEPARATAFKAEYKKRFNADPVFVPAAYYDTIHILAQAFRAVGTDPQEVADYISQLKNYEGVTGTLTFNNDCEVDRTSVNRTVKNGQLINL